MRIPKEEQLASNKIDTISLGAFVLVFKPWEELVVHNKDFDVSALKKFIEAGSSLNSGNRCLLKFL